MGHDTKSTASTDINIPFYQKDNITPYERFSRGGNNNLQPNFNPNFSDRYRC